MARRVFFSFHYEKDIWRVNQVRNAEVVQKRQNIVPFHDASIWEEAERHGNKTIRKLINDGLKNTSVTCVLIGAETAGRWWVMYEIAASLRRGNALLGVRIHRLKDKKGLTTRPGANPFTRLYQRGEELYYNDGLFSSAKRVCDAGDPLQDSGLTGLNFFFADPLSARVRVYDWAGDRGYENFPVWVENAFQRSKA